MILITSAKYVNPELQSEFGKIPPSFLPLGGKRLYEYQSKLFQNIDERIVLSLPESFELTQSDQKSLDKLGIKVERVPDGLTLGESIVYCINMNLPLSEGLHLLHGDTYFENLKFLPNSICIAEVEENYDWTYIAPDNVLKFNLTENNLQNIENLILSGYFHIGYPYHLVETIVRKRYSFIEGIKEYSNTYPLHSLKNNSWLDFGLVSTYFHSKKAITTERAFNLLSIENGYVTKSSSMPGKLDGEINWFEQFPSELSLYIPKFYKDRQNRWYKTEYLYANTLAELFVFGKHPLFVWKRIFIALKNFLTKLHQHTSTNTKDINFDYKYKTIERLKVFAKESAIDLRKGWIYNGLKMPSIYEIIDDIDLNLSSKKEHYTFIHGDFCFSNIMYDFKSGSIKIFDPRGIDFDGQVTVYGDRKYDYAKLMHSVIGLYDYIIAKHYDCKLENYEIRFSIDIDDGVSDIQTLFFDIFDFSSKEEIYAIMIHLFLSMLPLHNDDREKQNALLVNVFRLYKKLKEGL